MRALAGAALFAALALGVLSIAAPGCAAVIDASSELGDSCRFDGDEDTPCGLCMADACRAAVDACCGDAACAPALSQLDGCTGGNADDCDALAGADGAAEGLGACLRANCPASCTAGESVTLCADLFGRCSCSYEIGGLTNDETCSRQTVGGGLCCADLGWPDVGLACECESFTCRETADGCECSAGDQGPSATCEGTYCCADNFSCRCGETPCDEDMVPVEACTVDIYTCGENETPIDACSAVE